MAIYLTPSKTDGSGVALGALRWDLAWPLFVPDYVGDIPAGYPETVLGRLTAWAWDSLGDVAGRMRVDRVDPVWFVVPPLSPAAEEYVIRIASFWDDDVYWADADGARVGGNLWRAPIANISSPDLSGHLDQALKGAMDYGPGRNRVLFPHLGLGRMHVMVVEVEPGGASTRLHAHSADDEYYVPLSGKGTLRMGTHAVPIEAGMMIGKPVGPDLTSQILADRGESITILDLEVWPDPRQETKDVMYYADFGEVQLHGGGWSAVIPDTPLYSASDKRGHYSDGYQRNLDGTWTPTDIAGASARKAAD